MKIPVLGLNILWIMRADSNPAPLPPPPEFQPSSGFGSFLDSGSMFNSGFDPVVNALRCVDAGAPSGMFGSGMNLGQIIRDVWDPVWGAFRVVVLPGPGDDVHSPLSVGQIFRDVHDATAHALRVVPNAPDVDVKPFLSMAQALMAVHSYAHHALRIDSVVAASGNHGIDMYWKEAIRLAVDAAKSKIRVVG